MSKESAGPDLGDPLVGLADAPDPALSDYAPEDWAAFAFFWALAFVVFLQFFSRYVLNDSVAWTEEIARYLLICVCFVGGGMAVRKTSHIHVEFLYVYLPRVLARRLSLL
ncbi:MAG: TRAP transporter small permease subunit, partial [Alphaproteobacteria bacterium]|nr:TRAP transporter small permease subunit [Alphaproteobacteria bacterium]